MSQKKVLNTDFLIIGGGIIGSTITRAIASKYPNTKLILIDKEAHLG
jgi:L-2-hydroxyglutarate oxidase LhgO